MYSSLIGSTAHLVCSILFTIVFLVLVGFAVFVGVINILNGYFYSGIFLLFFVFIGLPLLCVCLFSYHIHYINRYGYGDEERNIQMRNQMPQNTNYAGNREHIPSTNTPSTDTL